MSKGAFNRALTLLFFFVLLKLQISRLIHITPHPKSRLFRKCQKHCTLSVSKDTKESIHVKRELHQHLKTMCHFCLFSAQPLNLKQHTDCLFIKWHTYSGSVKTQRADEEREWQSNDSRSLRGIWVPFNVDVLHRVDLCTLNVCMLVCAVCWEMAGSARACRHVYTAFVLRVWTVLWWT